MTTKTLWTMEDLENETNYKRDWLKRNVLKPYREEIEQFGHYPRNRNDEYSFIGRKMKEFIEERFNEIFNKEE